MPLVRRQLTDGWFQVPHSLTPTVTGGTGRFTVLGDQSHIYRKGLKLQILQSTTKYFYVIGVTGAATSTIEITAGTDYTFTNETVTQIYLSRAAAPQGFPSRFNWTPTFAGFSADPAGTHEFYIEGNWVYYSIRQTSGTSNATNYTWTLPVRCDTLPSGMIWVDRIAFAVDNGANSDTADYTLIDVNSPTICTMRKNHSATGWTASGTKRALLQGRYRF